MTLVESLVGNSNKDEVANRKTYLEWVGIANNCQSQPASETLQVIHGFSPDDISIDFVMIG